MTVAIGAPDRGPAARRRRSGRAVMCSNHRQPPAPARVWPDSVSRLTLRPVPAERNRAASRSTTSDPIPVPHSQMIGPRGTVFLPTLMNAEVQRAGHSCRRSPASSDRGSRRTMISCRRITGGWPGTVLRAPLRGPLPRPESQHLGVPSARGPSGRSLIPRPLAADLPHQPELPHPGHPVRYPRVHSAWAAPRRSDTVLHRPYSHPGVKRRPDAR